MRVERRDEKADSEREPHTLNESRAMPPAKKAKTSAASAPTANIKSNVSLAGGELIKLTHTSATCACEMVFSVYLPPQAASGPVPAVYWLSGLTCTDDNFSQKAGFAHAAASRGVAVVIPDTSRGVTIEGADDSYDFGSGAGFYIDATEPKWAGHYKMESYITDELPALVEAHFAGKIAPGKRSIFGHSMGGHGALTLALKHQTIHVGERVCANLPPNQLPVGHQGL